MPFTEKNWVDSPSTSTPLSAAALEDMETRLSDYADTRPGGVFNVKDYGADGDGTDDSTAIEAAATAARANGGVVYFPDTSGETYGITRALPGDVSYMGASRVITVKGLSGLASATNKMVLDLGYGTDVYGRTVKDLTLDASSLTGVQCVGSQDGRTGNATMVFDNIEFANSGSGVYAVGSTSGSGSGAGMLVGDVFNKCIWNGCAHALDIGISSDDITFVAPRFTMQPTGGGIGPYIKIAAGNINFVGAWIQLGSTGYASGAVTSIIHTAGSGPLRFSGLSLEAVGNTSDLTHIISTSASTVIVEAASIGGSGMPALTALIYAAATDGVTAGAVSVRGFYPATGAPSCPVLEANVGPSATGSLPFDFVGLDQWTSPMTVSGGTGGSPINLLGNHRGTPYNRATDKTAWNTPALPTVASATTTTLPAGEVITVSGSTTITSITASWVGRRVTLLFSSTAQVTDGSNLKLSANSTGAADRTLTLVCNGTNWYEVARSAN